jgi:hypothetical protein
MIFDKSKVYTAVNADEMSKGYIIYAADTLRRLKSFIDFDSDNNFFVKDVEDISSESNESRIGVIGMDGKIFYFNLAYLICPSYNAEAYKAWHEGKKIEKEYTEPDENETSVWKLFENENPDWYEAHYRPVPEYRPFDSLDELIAEFVKRFGFETPEDYAYPLIWVKLKGKNDRYLITGYIDNEENGELVKIGDKYYGLCVLFAGFQFLDGSPCGVKIER